MATDPQQQPAPEQPYTSPLVTMLRVDGREAEWPVCAHCRRSVWMTDRDQPIAFCYEYQAIIYGEGRQITACEAQDPLPPYLRRP